MRALDDNPRSASGLSQQLFHFPIRFNRQLSPAIRQTVSIQGRTIRRRPITTGLWSRPFSDILITSILKVNEPSRAGLSAIRFPLRRVIWPYTDIELTISQIHLRSRVGAIRTCTQRKHVQSIYKAIHDGKQRMSMIYGYRKTRCTFFF